MWGCLWVLAGLQTHTAPSAPLSPSFPIKPPKPQPLPPFPELHGGPAPSPPTPPPSRGHRLKAICSTAVLFHVHALQTLSYGRKMVSTVFHPCSLPGPAVCLKSAGIALSDHLSPLALMMAFPHSCRGLGVSLSTASPALPPPILFSVQAFFFLSLSECFAAVNNLEGMFLRSISPKTAWLWYALITGGAIICSLWCLITDTDTFSRYSSVVSTLH